MELGLCLGPNCAKAKAPQVEDVWFDGHEHLHAAVMDRVKNAAVFPADEG